MKSHKLSSATYQSRALKCFYWGWNLGFAWLSCPQEQKLEYKKFIFQIYTKNWPLVQGGGSQFGRSTPPADQISVQSKLTCLVVANMQENKSVLEQSNNCTYKHKIFSWQTSGLSHFVREKTKRKQTGCSNLEAEKILPVHWMSCFGKNKWVRIKLNFFTP